MTLVVQPRQGCIASGLLVLPSPDFGDAPDFALVRYNPNGSLDASFSGDGKQTTSFGGGDTATGVALQGDGRIVAVGSTTNFTSDFQFALARYQAE